MQSNANPLTQKDFSVAIFNDSDNIPRFNFSSELLTDVIKSSALMSMKVKSSNNVKEYDKTVLNGQVDTCKVSRGVIGNFIVRMLVDQLKDHSNFKFVCPQDKGFYYVRNLPIDLKNLPSFLTGNNVQWEISIIARIKTPASRRLVNTFNLKFYGSFNS